MSQYPVARTIGIACLGVLICLVPVLCPAAGYGPSDNADCLMCHSATTLSKTVGGQRVSLHVDPELFAASSHGASACVDCHTDLKDEPLKHEPDMGTVQCAGCHDDSEILDAYESGVHGALANTGLRAATCVGCHPAHTAQAAEEISACRQCHAEQFDAYIEGSHGIAFRNADENAPTCVTCHGGHGMKAASEPDSPTHPAKVSAMCAKCHDDPKLMKAYVLPTDRFKTYYDSYHGIANKHGDLDAATCASCHGAHKVLPSSDPASSISQENVPKTCGKCHPGANANFAKGKMHVVVAKHESKLLYYVSSGFKWLTVGTMVMLIGHIGLDIFSRVRRRLFGSGRGVSR